MIISASRVTAHVVKKIEIKGRWRQDEVGTGKDEAVLYSSM